MRLERIEVTPFAVIAGQILQERKTGYLTILKAPLRKILYWSQGELVMAISSAAEDSLAEMVVRRGLVSHERAAQIFARNPDETVAMAHESGLLDLSGRQALLREWLASQIRPLFDLEEGTAVFTEDDPLPPERRVFLQSTPAVLIDGVRSIANGLVLRRSLGDLQREIQPAREGRFTLDLLPLTEQERSIAEDVRAPVSIEAVLKNNLSNSVVAAKVVIALLTVGVFQVVDGHAASRAADEIDTQRDLELMATLGASDTRSLRAVAYSRQLSSLDHYQVLDIPRAATRSQITAAAERVKKTYDPATYPPIVRDSLQTIVLRVDEAVSVLNNAGKRAVYDRLIQAARGEGASAIHQRLTQRSVAEQNLAKAREVIAQGDYYGAIVLLKQAVRFAPDLGEAWYLLGACQERNPRWRRDAAESFQRALAIDPNSVEVLISLGDLYSNEGLISRAQTCWEDALKIDAENAQAKSRLKALGKK